MMRTFISFCLMGFAFLSAQSIPQSCPARQLCTFELASGSYAFGRVKAYEVAEADTTIKLISPQGLLHIPLTNVLQAWGENTPQTQRVVRELTPTNDLADFFRRNRFELNLKEDITQKIQELPKISDTFVPLNSKKHFEMSYNLESIPPFDFQRQTTIGVDDHLAISCFFSFIGCILSTFETELPENINNRKLQVQYRLNRGRITLGLGGGATRGGTNFTKFDVGGGIELLRLRRLYIQGEIGLGLMNFDALPKDINQTAREKYLIPHVQAELQVGFRFPRRAVERGLPFLDVYISRGGISTLKDGKASRQVFKGRGFSFSFPLK